MIGFWASFERRGDPTGDYLPAWPRFNGSQEWMSLDACETAESSDEPPAACPAARDISDLIAIHQLDLWASVLSA